MKVPEFGGGTSKMFLELPGIIFGAVALPTYQVVQLSPDKLRVEDVVNLIVVFSLNFDGRGLAGLLA